MATKTQPRPARTSPAKPTQRQIEKIILELLGNLLGEDAGDLRRRLKKDGGHMPVDSLDLFDVLVEFHQRTGIKLPKKQLTAKVMRSVSEFSRLAAAQG